MSDNATVIPPPVKGCLMLNASPIKSAPGVGCGSAGMLLFGIVLMLPLSMAATNELYISGGICQDKGIHYKILLQQVGIENYNKNIINNLFFV
jgi:hypothetical protein